MAHGHHVIYACDGFYPPVDNPGAAPPFVFNSAKAGSAIPLNFSLGGDQGLAIFAAGHPAAQAIACDSSAPLSPVEATVTAGQSHLQYDVESATYTYVWKTDKAWANSCRLLVVRLADGAEYQAYFRFSR